MIHDLRQAACTWSARARSVHDLCSVCGSKYVARDRGSGLRAILTWAHFIARLIEVVVVKSLNIQEPYSGRPRLPMYKSLH